MDWSEHHTMIQPLARDLYEAMSLREWHKAERLARQLSEVSFELQRACIANCVRSGEGYMYEGA